MKSLIMAIVQALVDKPEEVQIKEVIGEHAHVLELRVAKEDLGKVIGKGGAHASAIRTLMAAASGKEKKRWPQRRPHKPPKPPRLLTLPETLKRKLAKLLQGSP